MAKLLHEEDLIFNKPSLKELIRLVKNGSIYAIWPSTEEEFKEWNNTGYLKYAPRGEKLKSQKTAMTVYYGDHQDASNTGTIDQEETISKYNILVDSIDGYKNEIVDLQFYDNINEIYPNNLTLQKLDNNLDPYLDQNGYIKNQDEIISYGTNILSNYDQYVDILAKFKERVNAFAPKIIDSHYTVKDSNVFSSYKAFFTDTTTEINNNFSNLIGDVPNINSENEIQNLLIDENDIYHFEKLKELYSKKINLITKTLEYIKEYYNNTDQKLSFDYYNFQQLISIYENYYMTEVQQIESIINNGFYKEWNGVIEEAFLILNQMAIPRITLSLIPTDMRDIYYNDIELLLTDYVYKYKNLIQYLYIVKNYNQNITSNQAEDFYSSLINQLKTDPLYSQGDFNTKIDLINMKIIEPINVLLGNFKEKEQVFILFVSNGNFYNMDDILNQINYDYNIISYINSILTNFNELVPEEYQSIRYTSQLLNLSQLRTEIRSAFNNQLKVTNGINKIQLNQNNVQRYYKDACEDYINFIKDLKQLTMESVIPVNSFIANKDHLANENEIMQTINDQTTKVLNHYQVIQDEDIFNKDMSAQILALQMQAQDLKQTILNADIILVEQGDKQYFYDTVINPDETTDIENYTIENFNTIFKILTKSTDKIVYEEIDVIPQISEDGLLISNKDQIDAKITEIENYNKSINRRYDLVAKINRINQELNNWYPIWDSEIAGHYICIAVGSDITFENEIPYSKDANGEENRQNPLSDIKIDGTITIKVDGDYHYPKINGQATKISSATRNSEILTVGGLASLFGGEGNITDRSVGNHYVPMHLSKGVFTPCNKVISGAYKTTLKGGITYWNVVKYEDGEEKSVGLQANKLFGAVYNDYAEYRKAIAQPGQCVIENGDGSLSPSTGRLQLGANIVSDTYGFAIGETNDATCPIAVSGRALALPLEDKSMYTPGAAVCSGPNGTISLMTREEIREWPDAIVGFVSEVPTYDTWGSENVPVNGRIWIKIK